MLMFVSAILSISAQSVSRFFGRREVLFAHRDPGVSVTRLVMLSGSLRAGRDAHEFDRA